MNNYIQVEDEAGKPRGYAFVEFEHEADMRAAYKRGDGQKIDGRRVVVDVERGRTVRGWRPRRFGELFFFALFLAFFFGSLNNLFSVIFVVAGGGLGGSRRGGKDVNITLSGRYVLLSCFA